MKHSADHIAKRTAAIRRRLDAVAAAMHADYLAGLTLAAVARKHGRKSATNVWYLFKSRGLSCRPHETRQSPDVVAQRGATRRARLDGVVALMAADYESGLSLSEVGRKWGRNRRSVAELFARRGYSLRPCPTRNHCQRGRDGSYLPAKPLTVREIDRLVAGLTRIKIPDALRAEWRHWPLERRAWFIARVRARLQRVEDRPLLPFSANVTPFDYGTPAAHELARRLNTGRDSQHKAVQLKIVSQGAIYDGRMYFWAAEGAPGCGAYYVGPWRPGCGRPALHHVIWQQTHGRPVPAGHVVRHANGNRNDFTPANLVLATKNDVARENQAAGLTRKSRALTALLLARSSQPTTHVHTDIVQRLRQSR